MKKLKSFVVWLKTGIKDPKCWAATAVVVTAAFLRLYRFEAFATFLGDQGRDAIIIKRIVTFEHLTAIGAPSSIGQVFLGPFYYYFVAPFLPLFQFDPGGLVFAVALYSLIGLIISYFIVKKEVGYFSALIFAILVSFSLVQIELSRFSWNPNLLPVFAFITLYFWYKTLAEKKWYFPFLFGIFLSCSFQLHHLALLMGLPAAVMMIIQLLQKKISFIDTLKKVGLSLLGFALLSSPLILFDLKNRFLNTINLIKVFTQGDILSGQSLHKSVLDRMQDTLVALFHHVLNVNLSPNVAVVLFLIFAAGSIFIFFRSKNSFIQLHILNILLFILSFGVLNSARHMHYYGDIYYSIFLVVAYKLQYISKKKFIGYILIPLILILYIFLNAKDYYFFQQKPNNQINDARKIAQSIIPHVDKTPYQVVPLPIAVTDGHIRYFLEILGKRPLDYDSSVEGQELFVMCFYGEKCKIIGNPQWQVAAFRNAKIDTMWKLELVTIYKLVHEKK